MKKILLSEPRGFCSGVKKALQIVDEALIEHKNRIYVFNEIVHNKTIVEGLKSKGVIFTQDPSVITDNSILIYSAHGVSPEIKKQFQGKNISIIDATCPLVEKVHQEVIKYTDNGYHIIYIGKKDHDEAKGVIGEAPDNISVIESEKDINDINKTKNKFVVLTQTTLNVYEAEKLMQKIKDFIPAVEFPDKKDLCYATTSRQEAVKELAGKCDLFLILGSQNSSNSQKLKEVATTEGCNSYLIDSYKDIDDNWLENVETIGISSGASAPEYLIEQTITFLKETHGFSG
jgi:4-hydroxy-3-methylbut-2-en-1-yl diphosphate reductase